MAEEPNENSFREQVKELKKTASGRRVLARTMKEFAVGGGSGGSRGSKVSKERDKVYEEGFEKGKKEAEAAGKGTFGQIGAGLKSARERDEQYQIATMGTTRSRSKLMRLLGIDTGEFFQKNIDKKATPEEIEKAKKMFGMDEEIGRAHV